MAIVAIESGELARDFIQLLALVHYFGKTVLGDAEPFGLNKFDEMVQAFKNKITIEPYKSIWEANTQTGETLDKIEHALQLLKDFATTYNNDSQVQEIIDYMEAHQEDTIQ